MHRDHATLHQMFRLRLLFLAMFALFCISCGSGYEPPKQVDVERGMESGCRLVSMEGIEPGADAGANGHVFTTRYSADCATNVGSPSQRIAGVITLRKQAQWLGLKTSWVAENQRLAGPKSPASLAKSPDTIASTEADSMYSDGPGCNALMKRIADDMVPCLQRINPEMGKRLQATITTTRNYTGLSGGGPKRDALLIRIDEECRSYWRAILNQLDSKTPEGRCVQDPDGA